ncbi:hypothetical protein G3O00_00320 [Burkholderia sp. Ac-20384]|uniref:hypothetical protein n=1 Tax=Burkholderia TaxID=32008 RepID=UPI001452D211|nr:MULTISPECIES: hypothetical protein [Burkholderia]MBN3822063.1 hypothetical protein [Burkholderia sp. Ac-20384]VWB38182.1 hypothetical protein BLA6993_01691 [Burkholderia lata]
MHRLEQYYPGDASWQRFVAVFSQSRSKQEVLELAQSLDGDVDLATVIYEVVGPGYNTWIRRKVPAMDDLTPIDCIRDPALMNRLRTTLMRFPS